jgi:hypothetical protein
MGRIGQLVLEFKRKAVSSWRRYAEFVHGEEIKSFTKEQERSQWSMKSEIPASSKKMAIRDFAEMYPHGFQFNRTGNEYELTYVFSKGEIFRPERRCRVERELVQHNDAKKVYLLPDPSGWLEAIGFEDFNEEGMKAIRVAGSGDVVWVLLDPRPEVFARPLIEEIVRRREVEA